MVKSSFGHIRDLAKNGITIDNENGTYTPKYEVPKDKAKLVKELKDVAKASESVWLATDEGSRKVKPFRGTCVRY